MNFKAQRLAAVAPSASMAASLQANALKASGRDIIDLGLGEPDFDTPGHIIEAALQSARNGNTRYTPTAGAADLRDAVAKKFRRENDLDYSNDEIIICNGAKQVIFDALMATLEPGNEVILCAPHFDTYRSMTVVSGGVPVVVSCGAADSFRLTPDALEQAITPATRWLFLNMPSNPAGAVYDRSQLAELGEVLQRHPHVMVLSDEIYEHIIFDRRAFVSFVSACPLLRNRTLTVNGVSKAYAMTGWRIGYGAGPAELIRSMTTVQSQVTSGPASITQAGALAALTGPQDHIVQFCDAFERRRDLVVAGLSRISGLALSAPGGAFYAYVGCADYIGATTPQGEVIDSDTTLVRYLLNVTGVSMVPGSAYGLSPYFRLSTATSEENLAAATRRIADGLGTLKIS